MFTTQQKVMIRNTQREVVVDVLRTDLKPGIVVYETTVEGQFAGFFEESEMEMIAEVNQAKGDNQSC